VHFLISILNGFDTSMRMRLTMNASNIFVDSFAWLEILNGSDRGKIALAGARIRLDHKMGAVDSLILATAILHDPKVLTGDQHFEGMAEAVMI